jgi:hypothetical protein
LEVFEIRHYLTATGKNVLESWLGSLSEERLATHFANASPWSDYNVRTHGNGDAF